MAVDRFYNPFGNTGSYLEKSNEKIRRGRPFQMVLPLGHLDVFLLHHICARFVEEAKKDMELAPVPRWRYTSIPYSNKFYLLTKQCQAAANAIAFIVRNV